MLNKLFRNALGVAALGLSCFAAAVDKESVTFTGWQPVQTGTANIETGTLQTHVFTVGGYNLGRIRFEGHMDEINGVETLGVGDYGTETRIRVKYPDGRFKDISVTAITNYDTPPGLDFSGDFRLALGAAAPFGGGTWNFYLINTFDDQGDTLADCSINMTFYLTDEEPTTPPPPAGAVDLGTISDPGLTHNFDHVGGTVEWFKITVPEATMASKYFDIDTEGTTGIGDTEVGIYNIYGELVATDDDDGTGLLTQLSFGPGAGDRGNGGFGGVNYNGRDGILDPGVYYVACGEFNVTFNATNFDVTTTSTGSGPFTLNFRTNVVGGPSSSISGNVNLTDLDPMVWAGQSVTVEILDMGVPVATVVTTIDGSGNFSFPTPGAVTPGTYDITCKHAQFLRKALTGQTVTATGISGLSYNLINGDCDDDNEVGISDYAIISGSYNSCFPDPGFDSRSDLNGDTCCDIADYAILSANYGLTGD